MGIIGVKWIVSGTLGSILLIRHDGFWFSVLVGALLNAFGVKVLKRILKSPRPENCTKVDPGMPSSHAHMLSYFSSLAYFSGQRELGIAMFICAAIISSERVHRGIHTAEQIGVGLVTGSMGAYLWLNSDGHRTFMKYDDYLKSNDNWHAQAALVVCSLVGAALLSATGRFISGSVEDD